MKSFQNFSAPASARTLSISIRSHTHAEACIFDVQHQMIWKGELIVKDVVKDANLTWKNSMKINREGILLANVLDYRNDLNLYIKKNDGPMKTSKQLK